MVVRGHAHPHPLILGQELQQFEAGVVDVVVLARCHHVDIDGSMLAHGLAQN